MFQFQQKYLGPVAVGRRLAQTDLSTLQQQAQQLQAQQQAQGQQNMQNATGQMNQMLTQQAAQYQQTTDALSSLWWSMNWPYVAAGIGALGLVGYLVLRKK
jgi:hypothetical protein